MSEHSVQNDILRTFGTVPWCRLWRQNTGVGRYVDRSGRARTVQYGEPGQADLIGILRGGRWIEIECKSPKGRQSPEQRAREQTIRKFGGVYILARSVQDVWDGLRDQGFVAYPPPPGRE